MQLAEGDLPTLAALIAEDEGRLIVAMPEQVLGKVESCARKEARGRQVLRSSENRPRAPVGPQVREAGKLAPEGFGCGD